MDALQDFSCRETARQTKFKRRTVQHRPQDIREDEDYLNSGGKPAHTETLAP